MSTISGLNNPNMSTVPSWNPKIIQPDPIIMDHQIFPSYPNDASQLIW
jgi:hypothetical protein